MKAFPIISVGGRNYPTVVMGEDNFSGWFSKGKFASEEERSHAYTQTLETAYSLGVCGFSMSPHDTLLRALREFKRIHPDIICIANPHWQSHYRIGNDSLWEQKHISRLTPTVCARIDSVLAAQCSWCDGHDGKPQLTPEDIASIHLDEEEFKRQLALFDFCDFCLVGNMSTNALLLLDRTDIIELEIKLVRSVGMVPLGMCQGGGLALDGMEKLDVSGNWIWMNKDFAFPSLACAEKAVAVRTKPVTAYKVFSNKDGFDLIGSLKYILPRVDSIVIGVENDAQALATFSMLRRLSNIQ